MDEFVGAFLTEQPVQRARQVLLTLRVGGREGGRDLSCVWEPDLRAVESGWLAHLLGGRALGARVWVRLEPGSHLHTVLELRPAPQPPVRS